MSIRETINKILKIIFGELTTTLIILPILATITITLRKTVRVNIANKLEFTTYIATGLDIYLGLRFQTDKSKLYLLMVSDLGIKTVTMQNVLYDLAIMALEPLTYNTMPQQQQQQQQFIIKEVIHGIANTGTYSFTKAYKYVLEIPYEEFVNANVQLNDVVTITFI